LDQQAGSTWLADKGRKSVNFHAGCLKVLDTRRATGTNRNPRLISLRMNDTSRTDLRAFLFLVEKESADPAMGRKLLLVRQI
jgi:hypothetical protein